MTLELPVVDPVSITALLARLAGKPAANLATKLAMDKTWPERTAAAALRKVDKPRPQRALASWLRREEVLRDVLLAPNRPMASTAAELDRALREHPRWRRLPDDERLGRAETILNEIYDDVLIKHAGGALRIATTRLASQAEEHHEAQAQQGEAHQELLTTVANDVAQLVRGAGDEASRVRERLPLLPPPLHPTALAALESDPARTWRLVDGLTAQASKPRQSVQDWQQAPPQFLQDAPGSVLQLAAEACFAYGADTLGTSLLIAAADAGAPDRQTVLARAALAHGPGRTTEGLTVLAKAGTAQESPRPFVRATYALLHQEWEQVRSVLATWQPTTDADVVRRWVIENWLLFLGSEQPSVSGEMLDASIAQCRQALAQASSTQIEFALAERLLQRVAHSASQRPLHDLREAARLSASVCLQRRTWRGDGARALALGCQALFMTGDLRAIAELSTAQVPDAAQSATSTPLRFGGALPTPSVDELEDPRVRAHILFAQVMLRQHETEPDTDDLTAFDAARVRATWRERAGQDAEPAWRMAVAAASEEQLASALLGLAHTGTLDLPGLEVLEATDPRAAAQIRATSALARGEAAAAEQAVRLHAGDTLLAALLLGHAQEKAGRTDDAAETLLEAAQRFGDPDLGLEAMFVRLRADERDRAEQLAHRLLASDPDWSGRAEVLGVLAQLVAERGDFEAALAWAHAACDADPHHPRRRWLLIHLLMIQAKPEEAAAALREHPVPLVPETAEQARHWLAVLHEQGTRQEGAYAATIIAERFADDEELLASAVALSMRPPGAGPDNDTEEAESGAVAARQDAGEQGARGVVEKYFSRYPEGAVRAIKVPEPDSAESVLDAIAPYVRVDPDTARARREFHARMARQELPLGALAAATRRSYASLLFMHGFGVLPAAHPDPAEHRDGVENAIAALNARTFTDTTALVTLGGLPEPLRKRLLGAFSRYEVLDKTVRDLSRAQRDLVSRGDMTVGWDDVLQRASVHFTPQSELDRQRALARTTLKLAQAARVRSLPVDPYEPARDASFEPWWPHLSACRRLTLPLWVDDAMMRVLAKQYGTPAFSTAALLEALVQTGRMSGAEHEQAQRDLIQARTAVPHARVRYLEVAESEHWRIGTAAVALAQALNWADPLAAHRAFAELVPRILLGAPEALPDWLYLFARGVGYWFSGNPQLAGDLVGVLLTTCLHHEPLASRTPLLLLAARSALTETAYDPAAPGDPLESSVLLLASTYTDVLGAQGTPYIAGLFSQLEDADRNTVTRVLLAPRATDGLLHLPPQSQ